MAIETLPIPARFRDNIDTELAYEDGYYNGRDEAYDSLVCIDKDNFTEWLKMAIKSYGKQWKLAQRTEICPQTIVHWKTGKSFPRLDLLDAVCNEMGYEICIKKKDI